MSPPVLSWLSIGRAPSGNAESSSAILSWLVALVELAKEAGVLLVAKLDRVVVRKTMVLPFGKKAVTLAIPGPGGM